MLSDDNVNGSRQVPCLLEYCYSHTFSLLNSDLIPTLVLEMGYTTCFSGQFDLDRPLDDKTYQLLVGLSETRRVERAFRQEQGYGIDGEFYIEQGDDHGILIDDNKPPRTQPGLWCGWEPTEDRLHIRWNKGVR